MRGERRGPEGGPPPGARGLAALPQRVPPQLLFITGALTQYVGSAFAVLLFAIVPAAGVAWLRVVAAAGILAAWRRPWRGEWTRERLVLCATFGICLACMNLTFYLAIDRLPLGTAVAIEFIGPVTVAALGSRTRRDWTALALAFAGVLLLSGVHVEAEALGLVLILIAAALWAGYIVLGHRVAAETALRPQQGLAMGMIAGAVALAPLGIWKAQDAFGDPLVLLACLAVGAMASVVPYGLEQVAMTRLPRAKFALLLALLPASAAVVGAVVLGQIPTVVEVLGIAMICFASLMNSHEEVEEPVAEVHRSSASPRVATPADPPPTR